MPSRFRLPPAGSGCRGRRVSGGTAPAEPTASVRGPEALDRELGADLERGEPGCLRTEIGIDQRAETLAQPVGEGALRRLRRLDLAHALAEMPGIVGGAAHRHIDLRETGGGIVEVEGVEAKAGRRHVAIGDADRRAGGVAQDLEPRRLGRGARRRSGNVEPQVEDDPAGAAAVGVEAELERRAVAGVVVEDERLQAVHRQARVNRRAARGGRPPRRCDPHRPLPDLHDVVQG